MKYKVKTRERLFDYRFIQVEEAGVEIECYDGSFLELNRIGMLRSPVVCVLLFHPLKNKFVFVEQFRYSAIGICDPWVCEIVAGIVDRGEENEAAAIRECVEETGYRPRALEPVQQFMPSVGLSNQVVHLYYATVKDEDKIAEGGGLIDETEDIRIVETDTEEALEKAEQGGFIDAKTSIALSWFALNKA